MDESNLVQLDVLRVNNRHKKNCTCSPRKLEVDTVNHIVSCGKCGAILDPFEALVHLAHNHETLNAQLKAMRRQREEIQNYKPWLRVIKKIEEHYRGGKHKLLPVCPKCSQPFWLEDIKSWTSASLHSDAKEH